MPTLALLLLASALAAEAPAAPLPTLQVRELTEPGAAPGPSARARALAGARVRLVGFMAQLEEPSAGGFWLAPRPVECDESGAGTGDLPPGAVRVVVEGEPPQAILGPIAVAGRLEVGSRAEADGTVSFLRLQLDAPSPQPAQ